MQFAPNQPADFTTTITNADGDPVTPDSIVADVFDPSGQVVDDAIPTELSTGFFKYTYVIPADPEMGLWRINWKVVLNGQPAQGDEYFEVVPTGVIVAPADEIAQSQLRARLGEPKENPAGDGSETFFTDIEIIDLLAYAGDDLDVATLEGWRRKMARFARLIDVNESGADRPLSQKFKNAKSMVEFWSGIAGAAVIARQNALAGRVVGKAVNLRCDPPKTLLTPFSGYSEHVRMYPTHRMLIPAIL